MPITYYTQEDLEEAKNYSFIRGQEAERFAIINTLFLLRKFSGKRRKKEVESRISKLAEMETTKEPPLLAKQLLVELVLLNRPKRKKR